MCMYTFIYIIYMCIYVYIYIYIHIHKSLTYQREGHTNPRIMAYPDLHLPLRLSKLTGAGFVFAD